MGAEIRSIGTTHFLLLNYFNIFSNLFQILVWLKEKSVRIRGFDSLCHRGKHPQARVGSFCYNNNMKKWIALAVCVVVIWLIWPKRVPVKNAGRPVHKIVAFGDSLTAGYGAGGIQNSYPSLLAQLSGKTVINLGLSGDTAFNAPTRLPQVLAEQPDMVLIEFGGNDRIRGLGAESAANAVVQIVDAVQAVGAIAVVVDTGGPQMDAYTKAYKQIAKEKKAVFVPGIMRGIFNKRELKSDLIHPNAAGYQIVAERIYKEIKPYL